MDLGIPGIAAEIAREIAQNGTSIILTWDTWPPGTLKSKVDGSRPVPATPATETVTAFVHYVQPAGQASVRQFAELEVGDVILDFPDNVDLSGRENLRFNIGGQLYTSKKVPDKLAATWDVMIQNRKLFRTVLLSPAELRWRAFRAKMYIPTERSVWDVNTNVKTRAPKAVTPYKHPFKPAKYS
jgi:hypothetical protein